MNTHLIQRHRANPIPGLLRVLLTILCTARLQAQSYTPTDITVAGASFQPNAINDIGQIAGSYLPAGGAELPAVWQAGAARLLRAQQRAPIYTVPVVLVPSMVNGSEILDLLPDRSLLRWLAEQGFESYLLDFDGDIAGREMTVEFWSYLRDEVRFASPADLIDAMAEDVRRTRELVRDD